MAEVQRMVLVDFSEIIPVGDAQIIIRLHGDDRETVDLAASILTVGQGEFVRTAVVRAAHKIIQENAR